MDRAFSNEAQRLAERLAPWLMGGVEHIGSTAVPGLAAKPILAMLAPGEDLDRARAALTPLGDLGYRSTERRVICRYLRRNDIQCPAEAATPTAKSRSVQSTLGARPSS